MRETLHLKTTIIFDVFIALRLSEWRKIAIKINNLSIKYAQKKVPLNVQFVKENFWDFSKGYFLDEMNI